MESDISEFAISPFLSYYDLFKTRNVNSDRRRAFERIADEYLNSNEITDDILAYDDVELLRYAMYRRRTNNPLYILSFQSFKYPVYADRVARYFISHIDPQILNNISQEDPHEQAAIIEMSMIYPWFKEMYIIPILQSLSIQQIHFLWKDMLEGWFSDHFYREFFQLLRSILSDQDRRRIQPYLLFDLREVVERYNRIVREPVYGTWVKEEVKKRGMDKWRDDMTRYQPLIDNTQKAIDYLNEEFL